MEHKNESNILITSAGRRFELVEIWQKAVRSFLGSNSKVIACDMNPFESAACQIADDYFEICSVKEINFVDQLLEICIQKKIKLIIPTIDTELLVLSKVRNIFADHGIKIIVSDERLIRICRDKVKTINLFLELGLKSPKVYQKNNIIYPAFLKPIDGSSSKGIKKLNSSGDLSILDIDNSNNLFQEFVGKGWLEYSIDIYYNNDGYLLSCVPRERLEVRAGEISKGITRKNCVYDFVINKFSFLKGAKGAFTLQLFADINREQFLGIEINPRFGGGYPMSFASGANYPSMLIREHIYHEKMDFYDNWKSNVLFLRHDAMISLPLDQNKYD